MAYEMRALSFAEILDRTFRLIRDHFTLFLGIAAVVYVPYFVAVATINPELQPLLFLGIVFLFLAVTPLMQAALTVAISEVVLDRTPTIGDAYRGGLEVMFPLFGTYLLMLILLIPAFLALLIPGIYFSVAWMLIGPIAVVERRYGMGALRRSRDLVRGNWWRSLGIVFVASLLVGILGAILQVVWGFIPFLGTILNGLTQAVAAAFGLAVLVILYFDLRCRHEDFDLRYLAERIGSTGPAGAPLA